MNRTELDIYKVYDSWQKDLEGFQCYLKVTPFATLKNYNDFSLSDEVSPSLDNIKIFNRIKKFFSSNALYIIDFDSSTALDLALLLNNEAFVKPILSFNHIFHPFGIVGDESMAEKLLLYSDKLKVIKPKAYCFILDKERYQEDYLVDYMKFNNQYEITEEELPPVEVLQELKVSKVVYISKEFVKEDVKYYLEYLKANKVIVQEILKF
ncbi:hypothetical protein [Clostridium manihotivorum]|uniref:Normocyte-binding protein n=1 Tax=Clostridium manihotivorum TaxID=2320868 RepID=A0A410E0D7_9CLOT|nr:hypothetical protein [Clostridium manihotivorum]QAA34800.1 hypothetical protein C1I91_25925 [Clostridium manihotivorum]